MPVIPKLNLRKEQIDITSLNRWADAVQMALSELDGHSRVAVRNASESITTSNAVGNAQVLSLNPISNLVISAPVKTLSAANPGNPTQDNLPDGATHVRLLATHAASNVAYNFKGAWSSVTSYVIGDEVTFSNIYWIALANNSNSQPSSSNANWQAVGRIVGDVQIFTSSGTWSKPAAGTFSLITVIGGGGSGGAGGFGGTGAPSSGGTGGVGGGAGGFSTEIISLSVLGTTETITVGLGGTGGAAGGTSSFGNWLQATGGGGGNATAGKGNVAAGGLSLFPGAGATGGAGGSVSSGGGVSSGVGGLTGTSGASARVTPYTGGTGGTGGGSGTTGGNGNPGNPGTNASTDEPAGGGGAGGGGGGGASTTGQAGKGGAGATGGNYGAGGSGGGGGGASNTGSSGTGGASGNGAPGIVIVATF